ncbi:hypothetical protein V6N13_114947 [Hibiscus sabdariffa]|uniref:Uncharacterized protein n=1 Tax=Hibiscus sabdariffa TaxID=183260 RepID=A0ABR2U3V8_9ROSI
MSGTHMQAYTHSVGPTISASPVFTQTPGYILPSSTFGYFGSAMNSGSRLPSPTGYHYMLPMSSGSFPTFGALSGSGGLATTTTLPSKLLLLLMFFITPQHL